MIFNALNFSCTLGRTISLFSVNHLFVAKGSHGTLILFANVRHKLFLYACCVKCALSCLYTLSTTSGFSYKTKFLIVLRFSFFTSLLSHSSIVWVWGFFAKNQESSLTDSPSVYTLLQNFFSLHRTKQVSPVHSPPLYTKCLSWLYLISESTLLRKEALILPIPKRLQGLEASKKKPKS